MDTEKLNGHNHEEADTLMILHAIDVAECDPFRKLIVSSPDKDVFLLLIHFHQDLSSDTHFLTGIGDNRRLISISKAQQSLADRWSSLLGFHAFTGCDTTSKFLGKTKLSCWRTFIIASPHILEAFKHLGKLETDNEAIIHGLEAYVC